MLNNNIISIVDCSTLKTSPCASISLLCGCNEYPLTSFQQLNIGIERNGLGSFSLYILEDDIPETFLDCCCKLKVTVNWAEAGVTDFVAFYGRVTKRELYDKDNKILQFDGEGLNGILADYAIAYTPDSAGGLKCCPAGILVEDGVNSYSLQIEGETSLTLTDNFNDCGSPIVTYVENTNFEEGVTRVIDDSLPVCNAPALTTYQILNEVNVTATLSGNTVSATPVAVGAFSFDLEVYCDGVLNQTLSYNDNAIALVQPIARDLSISALWEQFTVDVTANDSFCNGAEISNFILDSTDNITVLENNNGAFTIEPLDLGAFSFTYEIFCNGVASGEIGTVTGTAVETPAVEYTITNLENVFVTPNPTTGEVIITPIDASFSFDYEATCNGINSGNVITVNGINGACITAIEAAAEFVLENTSAPLTDRVDSCVDGSCFIVNAPSDDQIAESDPYCGNGSMKNLLETLRSMSKVYGFDFEVQVIEDTSDGAACCLSYVISFDSVGNDLGGFVLSECLENVEVLAITDSCQTVNTVIVLGDDNYTYSLCIDQNDCGREMVIDASQEDYAGLTAVQRDLMMEGIAREAAAAVNIGRQVAFRTIWNCSFLPFAGDRSDIQYLWLGDTVLFEYENETTAHRVEKFALRIENKDGAGLVTEAVPVLEAL